MLYLENSHRDFLDVIVNYTGIQLLYITMQYNCRQISIFCYLARLYVSWIHRRKLKATQKKHCMFDNNNENLIRKTVIHISPYMIKGKHTGKKVVNTPQKLLPQCGRDISQINASSLIVSDPLRGIASFAQ